MPFMYIDSGDRYVSILLVSTSMLVEVYVQVFWFGLLSYFGYWNL